MPSLITSILAIAALTSMVATAAKITTLGQFAPGTWFENLAPTTEGHVLVTELFVPRVWSFNTFVPEEAPTLVHEYSQYESVLGITETYDPDVFAVSVGDISVVDGSLNFEPGSFDLWEIDYRVVPPSTRPIANFAEAAFINGLTYFPPANAVLGADSGRGLLWLVDLASGQVQLAANDTLMKACPGPLVLGINGIKYRQEESTLYFTNTNCQTMNKIELGSNGMAIGAAQTIANFGTGIDDFDIDRDGTFYVTDAANNQIISLDRDGGNIQVVAGGLNSSAIAEPTAVRLGITKEACYKGALYVTTAGGYLFPVNGTTDVGAQLVEVQQY